ncbi:MAG: hypothetical protein KDI01_08645 [Halioglobus sp.]|nr:hypothetical protein [Halioglobus sp.]
MPMQTIDKDQYQALRQGATVLAADAYGDKVLELRSGQLMKLFRRKRLFSSALFYPYSRRFVANVQRLSGLNIPTVSELSEYRIPSISRSAVKYKPLSGDSLEALIRQRRFDRQRIEQFAIFLAKLHRLGVYFRSVHLGNVVATPDNRLGLIDVADMKFYRRRLSASRCARNMRHVCRYREHVAALFPAGRRGWFLDSYLQALQLNDRQRRRYEAVISRQLDQHLVAAHQ